MILLTLGVEPLARLMEPEAPARDDAWLLLRLADAAEEEAEVFPAE